MKIVNTLRKQVEKEIRVLVVDDEKNIVSALKRILRDEKYPIDYFIDSVAAEKKLESTSYALVISDNIMPERTGIELLSEVKKVSPHTSRILLTGQTDATDAIKAFNDKIIHQYIDKPWDNDELLRQIRKSLDSFRYYRLKQLLEELKSQSVETKSGESRDLKFELQQAQTQLELTRFLATGGNLSLESPESPLSALIMSRNKESARLLAVALDKAGITNCRIYSNPETAQGHFNNIGSVDFVLSEWEKPEGAGASLIKSIRLKPGLNPRPIFIALMNSDNLADIENALSKGVDEYLVLPFKINELASKLQTTLNIRTNEKNQESALDMSGYKALIINRDPKVVVRIRDVLAAEGLTDIQSTKRGNSAISIMRNTTFSMVFYDVSVTDPYWQAFHDQLILKGIDCDQFIMFITGRDANPVPTNPASGLRRIAFMPEPYSGKRFQEIMQSFHEETCEDSQ